MVTSAIYFMISGFNVKAAAMIFSAIFIIVAVAVLPYICEIERIREARYE